MRFEKIVNRPVLFLFVSLVLILSGCREKEAAYTINLPATEIFSAKTNWAVIVSSHLRLREKPAADAKAVTTLWRGYVLEILSKEDSKTVVEEQPGYWYQISYDGLHGWVFGAYLAVYDSKEEAEAASRGLKK